MNLVKNDLVEPVQVKSEGMNMTEGSNSIQVKNEPTVPEDSVQVKGELVDQNQPTQSIADQEIQEVASQQDQTSLLPVPSFFFIFINFTSFLRCP